MEEPSDRKLNFGIWLAEKKPVLRKIFLICFFLIDFCLIGYAIYGAVKYYIIDWEKNQKLLQSYSQPINFTAYHQYNKPKDLEIIQTEVVVKSVAGERAGSKVAKRDYVAKLKNPNQKWSATFDYRFSPAAEYQKGFILPLEEKHLLQLNIDRQDLSLQDRLEIKDLKWSKTNAHEIPDYALYAGERLKFDIKEVKFRDSNDLMVKDLSEISFKISNASVYNFQSVDLKIILSQGTKIIGANSLILENFSSGERKDVQMNWLGYLPSSPKIDIEPQVNILDQEVYVEFESIPGERK